MVLISLCCVKFLRHVLVLHLSVDLLMKLRFYSHLILKTSFTSHVTSLENFFGEIREKYNKTNGIDNFITTTLATSDVTCFSDAV